MKKLFAITTLAVAALTSCLKEDGNRNKQLMEAVLQKYCLTQPFDVPIREGMITVVVLDGDTMYEGNLPTTIDIPRWATATRGASEVNCFYIPSTTQVMFGNSQRRGMLMFEDLPNGDNDYNDFVCDMFEHINIQKEKDGKYTIKLSGTHFTPLALGNSYTIPLSFGFEVRDAKTGALISEQILSDNVRNDWFGGGLGFINTVKGGDTYKAKNHANLVHDIETPLDNPVAFNWFIIAKGAKHYSTDATKFLKAGVTYNEVVTHKTVPFGMFMLETKKKDFNWPIEKCPIWDAYPKFRDWLNGNTDDPFATEVAANLYN